MPRYRYERQKTYRQQQPPKAELVACRVCGKHHRVDQPTWTILNSREIICYGGPAGLRCWQALQKNPSGRSTGAGVS